MSRKRLSQITSLVGYLTHFGLLLFYEYLFVVRWLGYPLYPGTATNVLSELIWINLQVFFWVLAFFIPSLILATISIFIPHALYWMLILIYVAAEALYEERFRGSNDV